MHSLRSAAVQYTNYGTGGAFELHTQSGTYSNNASITEAKIQCLIIIPVNVCILEFIIQLETVSRLYIQYVQKNTKLLLTECIVEDYEYFSQCIVYSFCS